jgi:outer membrane protein OmpA-like peptidoglycan-associated protein
MNKSISSTKLMVALLIAALMPLGVIPSSAAVNLKLCNSGAYVLLGSSIVNGSGTTITSSPSGALVGSASAAQLLALVPSEIGVLNQTNNAHYLQAMSDLRLALDEARSLWITGTEIITGELATDHSGAEALGTYTPGIYKTSKAMDILAGATITLDGKGQTNPFFYFIAGTAMTTGAGARVNLINGANENNVFWVTGSLSGDITLGAASIMPGTFLTNGHATLGAGVTMTGRFLTTGIVSLGANSRIHGVAANTTCTPVFSDVPNIIGKPSAEVRDALNPFKAGTITYDEINATSLNDGKVKSYSPSGSQVVGTPINYVLYRFDGKADVPNIIGVSATIARSNLIPNFNLGNSTGSTQVGATSLNNGNIASYSPTGRQTLGTTIAYTTYDYVAPVADLTKSIIYTDITLVDGRAGDPYSDNVVAKTTLGGIYVGAIVNYVMSGTAPQGLNFNQSSGYMTGTIASNAAIGDYSLTFTASSLGYISQSLTTSLRVTAAASTPSAVLGIIFTDITLVDGRAGDPYSDFVQAKGTIGGVYSTVTVNYVLIGALPLGLTFNPLTGYISGTISKDAIVGTYNIVVTAFAPGYPSQNLPFTFRVAAAPVITVIPSVIPAAPKTIVFTDTTLVNGHVGRSYADYVKAKAFIGSVSNNDKVTYSLTGILPDGLSFSNSTGYITGSVSKTATPGLYKVNVTAYSSGYVNAQLPFEFTILAAGTTAKPVTPTASPTPTPIATTAPKLNLLGTVWFDSGKSVLLPSSKMSLDLMVKALKGMNTTKLSISGYTDAVTGQSHSVLSLARASAVKKYLLSKNNALVITTKGLGIAVTSKSSTASIQASRMARVWVG